MSNKTDGNQNPQSAKVLKLGLNISVSGDPGTDFEIVLDDKEQKAIQSSSSKEENLECFDAIESENSRTGKPKHEVEKTNTQESSSKSTGAIPKHGKNLNSTSCWETTKMSRSENEEDQTSQEPSIITKLKNTMEHFEKFSDHIKDIPRLRNRPLATSTPLSDKYNSRSESSLVCLESKPRKYPHLYDYYSRKEYFKSSFKPSPPDLFLKPLPGEGCHMRGVYTRYFDLEPYRHYGSDNSLDKTSENRNFYGKSSYNVDKYEMLLPEPPVGILKKSDSESGDKQSTSSADSVKDIKIYQSGGILIMQNFKDNMDASEKKEMSEFSAKLIENCKKLKMEVSGFQNGKPAIGGNSDETKNSGKMVQFDLSSFEGPKSKSGDSSSNAVKDESSLRMESSESISDCMKKDTSPQGTSQSQDLTSLSTQENDSIMSNPPGLSPTYASSKKLEWDSGADIGYLNLDLTKENLSTIEKIVLKGLSSDGLSEENIVYEKKPNSGHKARSKLTLERSDTGNLMKAREERVVVGDEKAERKKELESSSEGERIIFLKESSKDELQSEETKPSHQTSSKRSTTPKSNDSESREKPKELTDKSVNVNTLFEDLTPSDQSFPKEIIRPSKPHTKVTHRRSSHSPKGKFSKHSTRPSSTRRASKKPSITGPLVTSYFDMGNPKKVYKKVEGSPALNDVELSREVEEIIIDQRFKIKQTGRETTKESDTNTDDMKEVKTKTRPISASSGSNNTILRKSDRREQREEKESERGKFTDQKIQTSDYDCESIGVQAFESQVQSDSDLKSFKVKETKPKEKIPKESVNVSSKNIQAFGLNCSLPKQLEHPKGTEPVDIQNTKSTQYFGGALNSLPNYHSNVATKPQETCGRTPNVLKTKKNPEIIRVKEQNEKNILANDSQEKHPVKLKTNNENKENLISEKSSNSKRSQRKQSSPGTNAINSETKESEREQKKKSSAEGSDCLPTSDDVSSLVLTSEALKVHGDSVDRSIIQEKYFQSQLDELEKRKMISRSTSMEIQIDTVTKEYMTTGCQYSPQSRGTTSGGQEPEDESLKGDRKSVQQRESNTNQGDSLPSSTQTAHSWVPGMRNSQENSPGVGKARSFEYLPGHIYESSGNLREELPSETEQNLITSSSSDSNTARGSVSDDGGKESEGRETLILENSTVSSSKSDPLKILDVNLALLNVAVTNLREKDAEMQNVTKSLLANLCTKNGSGDWASIAKMEDENDERDGEESKSSARGGNKEFAIACQTEEKSPSSYYEERKAFERRISEEKRCQIKWIENEIYHLNILRRLLEKQSSPHSRKQSILSPTCNDTIKSNENYQKNSVEICPQTVTSAFGCTISLAGKVPQGGSRPDSVQSNGQPRDPDPHPSQYGVTVSLPSIGNNWRQVIMLPASVQVSMKDPESEIQSEIEDKENLEGFHWKNSSTDFGIPQELFQCNVQTQCPSRRSSDNFPSVFVQTEAQSLRSGNCTKENCFCINLSDKSGSSSSKASARRESLKLNSITEECMNEISNSAVSHPRRQTKHFEELLDSVAKCRPSQNTTCKCQNRSAKTVKSTCHGSCQSNVYLTCDTSNNRSCRCSKIQVEKSSSCNCHVIKIHGSKCCCTSERNFCSCKGTIGKKTENQSCQTECESEVKNLYEAEMSTELKKGVVEKLPCEVKVGYETLESSTEKLKHQEKMALERSVQEIPVRDKTPNCSCKKKSEKIDDHPRHYFLKIEEKEVDESIEEMQKKSLEVVTVTVPVKKAGRSKIYGKKIRQTREIDSDSFINGCNCCENCLKNCRNVMEKLEFRDGCRKVGKQDSLIRTDDSYGDLSLSNEYNKEIDGEEYCSVGKNSFSQLEPWYCDKPANYTPEKQCCEGCRCVNRNSPPSRDIESVYDSHKKRKEFGECENGGVYEEKRIGESKSRLQPESGSNSRGSRSQGRDRYDRDYYNYNKREFMTKSELAKEEERKRKVHQPSLQECLSSNRPDFYSSAERRRQIISERSKERVKKHNSRMDCLLKMMQHCNQIGKPPNPEPKRIFTSVQMREQTMKRYKKLPEVTGKIADERKKEEYRTNRLMADIFAKKLQSEALKGHINLSNSVSVLYTI